MSHCYGETNSIWGREWVIYSYHILTTYSHQWSHPKEGLAFLFGERTTSYHWPWRDDVNVWDWTSWLLMQTPMSPRTWGWLNLLIFVRYPWSLFCQSTLHASSYNYVIFLTNLRMYLHWATFSGMVGSEVTEISWALH